MDDQNNITPINPAPSQAPGAPSNPAGPAAPEQPASPASSDPQTAISSDPGEISNADRIAKLEEDLAVMARMVLDATLADGAGMVPVQVAAQENGQRVDKTVQVPVPEFLIGLANKVGYAHRVRAPEEG